LGQKRNYLRLPFNWFPCHLAGWGGLITENCKLKFIKRSANGRRNDPTVLKTVGGFSRLMPAVFPTQPYYDPVWLLMVTRTERSRKSIVEGKHPGEGMALRFPVLNIGISYFEFILDFEFRTLISLYLGLIFSHVVHPIAG
jgi:hypothetical protein